ncbi:SCO family protein [Flavicella sediminum]|uniref:SCO family protein n=1 Tax=Flavicella sediminum TaxID=2585141 RepID=UPI00293920CC|nr:SCO family protein [Flavicella sediminum]
MKNNSWILILLIFVACKNDKQYTGSRVANLPYYRDASFTPFWLVPGSEEEKNFHKIPAFNLINQLGDSINHKTFEGKIYITDFFFTSCPGICPAMTKNMAKIQEKFKEDASVLLLSHSVTPAKDSVPVLLDYANNKGVIPNKWHLVTSTRKQIYELGRKHYFVENDLGEKKSDEDFLHTENFLLIDKNKHIRGIYNGLNRTSIAQLITDIETLKLE